MGTTRTTDTPWPRAYGVSCRARAGLRYAALRRRFAPATWVPRSLGLATEELGVLCFSRRRLHDGEAELCQGADGPARSGAAARGSQPLVSALMIGVPRP